MLKNLCTTLLLATLIFPSAVHADMASYFNGLKQDVKSTWTDGTPNILIPLRVWHNRWTYDDEHIDKYNEEPWGAGFGLTRYDDLDWHGLYAIAFKDSNDHPQTMFGYAYLKNHAIQDNRDFLFGYGYTLGLTQREEYSFIPVPLPLPMIGLTYKKASLNATYVPGVKNDGNVLFTWLRIDL